MELFELNQKIVNKTIPKIMIFTGDEYSIMNLYISQIAKTLNLTITEVNSCVPILKINKGFMLSGKNKLYVSRYESEIISNEKVWENNSVVLENNYLVIILANIDKRSKFYKRFVEDIIVFNPLENSQVINMLKGKHQLGDKAIQRLVDKCDNNYSKILLELDKIKSIISNTKDWDTAYKQLIKDEVMCESCNVEKTEFINKLMHKDSSCIIIYDKLKKSGENNLVLLMWMYNAFRGQLIFETVKSPSVKSTGLNYFALQDAYSRAKIYSVTELKKCVDIVRNVEQGIKNGLIDEAISIEYTLAQVL